MARPKIVVLGAAGQLGREWVDRLKASGHPYEAYGSAEADITQTVRIQELICEGRPDVVVNCAAYTKVDLAETEREQAFLVNAQAPGEIAAVCAGEGVRYVHFSSDYVYPGLESDRLKFPQWYSESAVTDPMNTYGQSKLEGDLRAMEADPDALIVRVSWLCGHHGHNFVKTVLRLAREKGEMRIVADQWGSPSFADNVVENTLALISRRKAGIYHVTSLGLTTWHEIARTVVETAGLGARVEAITADEYPTAARRPSFSKLDTSKLAEVDGAMLEDWQTGLKRLLGQILHN